MSEQAWDADQERAVFTARAQAIVEALAAYEEGHTSVPGTPCFSEALALMTAVMQP